MRGYSTRFYRKWQLIPDDYPSWLDCTNKVRAYTYTGLVAAVAHDYKKNHFHGQHMRRVDQLVKDLRVSSKELLDENIWVDEETKRLVTEKLEGMSVLPGFPEWVSNVSSLDRFYDKLIIHKGDHFGNVVRMNAFLQASNLAILGNKNYPNLKWNFSPFLINAFYDLSHNSVTLPAGIMQHPFYTGQDNIPLRTRRKKGRRHVGRQKHRTRTSRRARKRRSTQSILLALDYGRFGSVVGHEITHAFDEDGFLYDESGQMYAWSSRMSLFLKNSLCFMKQNGRQQQLPVFQDTMNEDIADNGGLRKAYRAFKRAWSRVGGINATLPDLTSFTPEQLFFLGYATLWCHAGEDFSYDGHSPARDRAIKPLSNMKEFSDAWGCTTDSPMNPRDKCVLW
jgi:predicted metalloendopeptidase